LGPGDGPKSKKRFFVQQGSHSVDDREKDRNNHQPILNCRTKWRRDGIDALRDSERWNAVSPGVIDTPYHEQFSTPEMMKNYVNAIPLGRVGKAEEVASVIVFLASDAASYLAGETIEINGGMYMD
jgi:enoyl-ACP reductase-like protein